jgi:receptor-type tyrosine-protein phosphatase gamma
MVHQEAYKSHVSVMINEVIEFLDPRENETYLDMTFGAGGHTRQILETSKSVKVIALDRDPTAHQMAMELSKEFPGRVIPLLGRFSELPDLLNAQNIKQKSIDGILFDFGCSSMQFDQAFRGFSLSKNGPLDMRMDKDRSPDQLSAADILARIDENDLAKIIKVYGEEKQAKKIAKAIVDTRYSFKRLETTWDLADVVASCFDEDDMRVDKLQRPAHPATKTFQAIRIFVNNELNEINYGMIVADRFLKIGGKIVAISFHSLEDVIVKRHIMGNVIEDVANRLPLKYTSHMVSHEKELLDTIMKSNWHQLTKHVVTPKLEEIENNPR